MYNCTAGLQLDAGGFVFEYAYADMQNRDVHVQLYAYADMQNSDAPVATILVHVPEVQL